MSEPIDREWQDLASEATYRESLRRNLLGMYLPKRFLKQ